MSSVEMRYTVINDVDIIEEMIEESLNAHDTYRKSLDGTESILKFNEIHPNTMQGYVKLTCSQMKEYLITNSASWANPEP